MVGHAAWRAMVAAGMLVGLAGGVWGQEKPRDGSGGAGATSGGNGAIGGAVAREVKGLSSEDFPEREAALKRLQELIGAQVKQRAEIQAIVDSLQQDLAKQEKALAMVSDLEAQAEIAGLLEMERGMAGWTAETMSEPAERRRALLDWGLAADTAPILARAYSGKLKMRLEGIKALAKLQDDKTGGASWTLARLVNDQENPVRTAAMAVCWDRKATADVVGALWFRAVSGPAAKSESQKNQDSDNSTDELKVDFPGGDPVMFDSDTQPGEFADSPLAGDVLVHLRSPLVAERVKKLVAERIKGDKLLVLEESDPDWTQVTHNLVEAYEVKEAIPMLANEALGTQTDGMSGDMNGRPFFWSRRTMAIGTLSKLIGKDPGDFQVLMARDNGDPRRWMWAVDMNPGAPGMAGVGDGAAVRAFYGWWKDHHTEYGVKEEPSSAGVPRARGRGRGMILPNVDPAIVPPAEPPVRPLPAATQQN